MKKKPIDKRAPTRRTDEHRPPNWAGLCLDYLKWAETATRKVAGQNRAMRVACLRMHYPPIHRIEEMLVERPERFTPEERIEIRAIVRRMSRGIPDEEWRGK